MSSKTEFSEVMEFEFKSFFASAGARKSDVEGERQRREDFPKARYELDWWRDSQGGMASRAHISNAGGSWLFAMQREMVKCSKV